MTKTRKMGLLAAAGLGMGLLASTLTLAQDNAPPAGGGGQPGGQGGGPGGGRGGEFRARMEEMMKERLSVGEDEWKVIQPRIQNIMQAQMQSRGGMMAMFGGRGRGGPGGGGGQGGPGGDMPQSEVVKAAQELSTVLETKDSKPEDVKAKLTALRQARDKARQEITKAQGELREIVTPRQEAVLVMMNVLD